MRSKNNPNPSRVVMKNKLYSGQKPCFVPVCKKNALKAVKLGILMSRFWPMVANEGIFLMVMISESMLPSPLMQVAYVTNVSQYRHR